MKSDPTKFSEISQSYQAIVRSLVDCDVDNPPDSIRPHELETFRRIYLDSAFICRYRECDRYSDGFRTSEERDAHEKMHAKPFRCADPTCEFWARGFTSKTGLQKHNGKYHPGPDELPLPNFETRMKEQETLQARPAAAEPLPTLLPTFYSRFKPVDPLSTPPTLRSMIGHLTPPPSQSSSEPQEVGAKRNPIWRDRVSKAKKGRPVHYCDQCPKVRTETSYLRSEN